MGNIALNAFAVALLQNVVVKIVVPIVIFILTICVGRVIRIIYLLNYIIITANRWMQIKLIEVVESGRIFKTKCIDMCPSLLSP